MNEFTLINALRLARKHVVKSSILGFSVLLVGWLAMVLWPRSYGSEAKLFIRIGRESVTLDPTATTGETLMLQKTQEDEVNSALEILESRGIHEKLVEVITPETILTGEIPTEDGTEHPTNPIADRFAQIADAFGGLVNSLVDLSQVRDHISDKERAIVRLSHMVTVNANKNSTMISIYTEAKSPQLAQLISQTMATMYLKEHLRIHETPGSKEFFEDTSSELSKQLMTTADEIRRYKQDNQILSIEDNRLALRANLESTDAAYQQTRRDIEYTIAHVADLSARIEKLPLEVISSKEATTWSGMRQRLFELQVEEKRLLATASEQHPALIKVRNQRIDLEKLLADFEAESNDETTAQNPIRLQLEQELISTKAQLAGQRARLEGPNGLLKQREEIESQMELLAQHEMHLRQLERELMILEAKYRQRVDKLEEASIGLELESRKISNVSIAQPA
ncbi:MAG: hypothetical protein KDB27_11810, partial [Planctomycetales bacterium]|nr:hypothetical protein [Planctomycetales bacterium]